MSLCYLKRSYLFFFIIFMICFSSIADKKVIVSGSSEGTPDKAGELALTDALRNAVRKGAGVDIISESKVSNFESEYDRVMTSSFGYVKDYKILEQNYDTENGIYTVKIEADVGKKTPGMDKVMALRVLVKRMDSPRVTVASKERIRGLDTFDDDDPIALAVIEEMAQKTGFQLFNQNAIDDQNSRDSLRAELLGDTLESKVKKAGITSTSDFKIISKIKGSVGREREPFPDVYVRDVALGIDLRAVWTDTGEVIATISIPTVRFKGEKNLNLPYDMPEQLVRYYLNRTLKGKEPGFEKNNAYKLFTRIIAKWITELDLGAKIKLEFNKTDRETLNIIVAGLKELKEVSYVWIREFDKRLFSVVEVETRLTSVQLADAILTIMKKNNINYEVDRTTKKNVHFIPVKSK